MFLAKSRVVTKLQFGHRRYQLRACCGGEGFGGIYFRPSSPSPLLHSDAHVTQIFNQASHELEQQFKREL